MPPPEPAPRRVAVMQPYLFPYAGYFRLFAAADEFVLYDCVQFPRRGRVHRSEVGSGRDGPQWLTLPLATQARETRIDQLGFAPGARAELDRRLASFPWFERGDGDGAEALRALLRGPLEDVVGLLQASLELSCRLLGLPTRIRRSSSLDIDPELRGQERVLAIARAVGAGHYLNPPGGRALYSRERFKQAGLQLEFLSDYDGPHRHLLPALMTGPATAVRDDLLARTRILPA